MKIIKLRIVDFFNISISAALGLIVIAVIEKPTAEQLAAYPLIYFIWLYVSIVATVYYVWINIQLPISKYKINTILSRFGIGVLLFCFLSWITLTIAISGSNFDYKIFKIIFFTSVAISLFQNGFHLLSGKYDFISNNEIDYLQKNITLLSVMLLWCISSFLLAECGMVLYVFIKFMA